MIARTKTFYSANQRIRGRETSDAETQRRGGRTWRGLRKHLSRVDLYTETPRQGERELSRRPIVHVHPLHVGRIAIPVRTQIPFPFLTADVDPPHVEWVY